MISIDDAEPERRHARPADGHHPGDLVGPTVPAPRGERAHRDPERDRDQAGDEPARAVAVSLSTNTSDTGRVRHGRPAQLALEHPLSQARYCTGSGSSSPNRSSTAAPPRGHARLDVGTDRRSPDAHQREHDDGRDDAPGTAGPAAAGARSREPSFAITSPRGDRASPTWSAVHCVSPCRTASSAGSGRGHIGLRHDVVEPVAVRQHDVLLRREDARRLVVHHAAGARRTSPRERRGRVSRLAASIIVAISSGFS